MAWREETVSLQAETDVVVLGMVGVGGKGIGFEKYATQNWVGEDGTESRGIVEGRETSKWEYWPPMVRWWVCICTGPNQPQSNFEAA